MARGVCSSVLGFLLAAAIPATVLAQVADPVGGGPEKDVVFRVGTDPAIPKPNHPPFDQIPPIPMPQSAPVRNGPIDTTSTLYDATTGQRIKLPGLPPSGREGGTGGTQFFGVAGEAPVETSQNTFSAMSNASGLTSFPASAQVKLVMRFADAANNSYYFAASGSMQDAGTVLTGSHCVYTRSFVDSNGVNHVINDFAREIWVYPGWDGVTGGVFSGPSGTDVLNNWGWCRGTYFLASNDWINTGGFDYDCALIGCFDRSVGMLTGWHPYSWGYDCGTVEGRIYYNFSYPAENCGGGLHTGRQMMIWSGHFDSCPGNQLHINTTPGCYTALWGGQSGSGAYWYDGTNRFMHATASNSNRTTSGQYAKLWEQFTIDMGGFENTVRGPGFDPEALKFRVNGTTTAQAGTSFPASSALIANASNADPATQTYTLRVYLSTNNSIDTSDTLLATWNYNIDFAPMQNWTFNVPAPFVPSNVPPGTYYMGVILTAPGDVNTSNNATKTWDTQQVVVTAAAPSNDTCAGALTLNANSTVFGNNGTANNEGATACATTGHDVWYRFTPSCTGAYDFTTCGSAIDTVLSLHSACPGTAANQIICNDDDFNVHCGSGFIRDSWFSVNLVGGTTYYVRVAAYGTGAGGAYALAVNFPPPANNDCGSATPVGDGSYPYSNCGATTDGPVEVDQCNFFNDPDIGSDIWFRYTAPVTGFADAALCGSAYDTDIAVYGGSCPFTPGQVIVCNDDDLNVHCTFGGIRASFAEFPVIAGNEYLIRVGGYAGSTGSGTLYMSSREELPTTGGCCLSGQCSISTAADCAGQGGIYQGDGTDCGGVVCTPGCGSADFNGDGDVGTDADIEAFFACIAGNCCPTCGSADFNGDGDIGTDSDIEAFFRVLSGGAC